MRFSRDFPDVLRSNIAISRLISKFVKLKKRGVEYLGLCPFHNENTPSFSVNDQKGFYHCFGCGAHGDIISFLMNKEGLDFKESVIRLANDFSIEIPQIDNFDQKKQNIIDQKFKLLEDICCYFQSNLYKEESQNIRNYLKKRNINKQIAQIFRLGYANDSYDDLVNYLTKKSYQQQELIESGVIGRGAKGNLYDKMRDRVIFPISNKKGQIIAFGGRVMNKDIMPKYLNSAETSLFHKKNTLYNFFNARSEIFKQKEAIIVEGYMDVIAMNIFGIKNIVAGLGTALSHEHIMQLFNMVDKVIVFLDGDNAGYLAAKRVCEIALPIINSDKSLYFAFLPKDYDPDDFISQFGKEKTSELLSNSLPVSHAMIDFAISDIGLRDVKNITAENKAKLENYLLSKVGLIKDNLSKKYFSQFFKDYIYKLGRSNSSYNIKIKKDNISKVKSEEKKLKFSEELACNILAYIIKNKELVEYSDNYFNIETLEFADEQLNMAKDNILDIINLENDAAQDKIIKELENSVNNNYFIYITNLLSKINIDDHCILKFRILLLKDLLLKVNLQYKELIDNEGGILTSNSALKCQKITEIFNYKNTLEKEINTLELEIT
ncbi:MAG: DNA primase [Rickettsiales bacterium]|nr:DNA primase [Rickettsiales bacterium]